MCNVLLAWATLQQPYLSKMLSTPPPKNPNKWTHSVIFEPHKPHKITSFLDFKPFINGFQTINKYLDDLWTRSTGSILLLIFIYPYCLY